MDGFERYDALERDIQKRQETLANLRERQRNETEIIERLRKQQRELLNDIKAKVTPK